MRDQDRIESYIIAKGKFVSKEILDKFILEGRKPEQMVLQDNQFMQFLTENDSDLLNRFKEHLKSIEKCSLTQEGTYLHQKNDEYLIFSNYQMALYIQAGKNNGYKGFNYRFQQSLYIGDFKEQIKSNGNGKILITDKIDSKTVWHIFDGDWQNGQIVQGERISYQNYRLKQGLMIRYKGGFKNYQFEGEGTREIPGRKTYKGRFKNGKKQEKIDKKQNLILLDFQDEEIEEHHLRRHQPDQLSEQDQLSKHDQFSKNNRPSQYDRLNQYDQSKSANKKKKSQGHKKKEGQEKKESNRQANFSMDLIDK